MICKYFLPFGRLPFCFVGLFFCAETFEFDVGPLVIFPCVAFAFGVKYKKSSPRLMSRSLLSVFFVRVL